MQPGNVAYTFNLNPQETEAGRSLAFEASLVTGQPGLAT